MFHRACQQCLFYLHISSFNVRIAVAGLQVLPCYVGDQFFYRGLPCYVGEKRAFLNRSTWLCRGRSFFLIGVPCYVGKKRGEAFLNRSTRL